MKENVFKLPKEHEILIAPSLLSADFANLEREINKVEKADCKWLHLDIMDGHFVPNITFGPPLVKSIRKVSNKLFFDAHLMIEHPLDFIKPFADAGANNITVHIETKDDIRKMLKLMGKYNVFKGISIKPNTPVSSLKPYFKELDLILVMSVEPGFGGQSLISSTLSKVRELKLLRDKNKYKYLIEIDGGITKTNAPMAVSAGANILVAGSSVFANGKVAQNVHAILSAISNDLERE